MGTSSRAVALRSELDALPINEESGVAYTSRTPGTMHACGHDGHMAMLLGAAAVLAEEGGFDGTVRTICQPAEEPGRGAQAMVDAGLFERFPADAVYGIHNIPGLPEFAPTINDEHCVEIAHRAAVTALGANRVAIDAKPIMASEDFGVLAQQVPACLAFLGNGIDTDDGGIPLHSHDYVFNDTILTAGVAYYRQIIRTTLPTASPRMCAAGAATAPSSESMARDAVGSQAHGH